MNLKRAKFFAQNNEVFKEYRNANKTSFITDMNRENLDSTTLSLTNK